MLCWFYDKKCDHYLFSSVIIKVNQRGYRRSGKIFNAISSSLLQQSYNCAWLLCMINCLPIGYVPSYLFP